MRSYNLEKRAGKIRTHYSRWTGQAALYVQYCEKNDKSRKGACVCFCLLVTLSVDVVQCVGLSVSTCVFLSVSLRVSALSLIYISMYVCS